MTRNQLEMLVRTHQAEIYRYVRYLGADTSESEDLVQEVFLAAFKAKTKPDLTAVKKRAAWLRGIGRNLFYAHCRRETRHRAVKTELTLQQDEEYWVSSFLRGGSGFDFHEALRKCLASLPEKSRRVLDLFYTEGLSREQTARTAGMTPEGVKSLLRRIRLKLGECVLKTVKEVATS